MPNCKVGSLNQRYPARAWKWKVLVTQLCPTLCNPMDCRLPGSYVHGIFQARIVEWVATPFCRGSSPTQGSNLGLLHCRQILYCLSHHGGMTPNSWKTTWANISQFRLQAAWRTCKVFFCSNNESQFDQSRKVSGIIDLIGDYPVSLF